MIIARQWSRLACVNSILPLKHIYCSLGSRHLKMVARTSILASLRSTGIRLIYHKVNHFTSFRQKYPRVFQALSADYRSLGPQLPPDPEGSSTQLQSHPSSADLWPYYVNVSMCALPVSREYGGGSSHRYFAYKHRLCTHGGDVWLLEHLITAHLKNALTSVSSFIAFTCKNRLSSGVRRISGTGNRCILLASVRRVYNL